MGTRSYIGREYGDGSVRAVYCHWDGYPAQTGRLLVKYWDAEGLECLLDEGDMSSLGKELGTKHDFNNSPADVCNFYGRDRGEKGTEAKVHGGFEEFLRSAGGCGAEYAYLHDGTAWRCWSLEGDPVELHISSRSSEFWDEE